MSGYFFIALIIILIIIGAIYLHSNNDLSSVTTILSQKRYHRTSIKGHSKKFIHLIVHKKNPKEKLSIICPSCHYKVSVNKTGKSQCTVCHQPLEFL